MIQQHFKAAENRLKSSLVLAPWAPPQIPTFELKQQEDTVVNEEISTDSNSFADSITPDSRN